MREYNEKIADAVREFLDGDGWNYEWNAEEGFFALGYNSKKRFKTLKILIILSKDSIAVFTEFPLNVDKEQYQRVSEYLIRINCRLNVGNLDLDMDRGEVRFRTAMEFPNAFPSREQIIGLFINGIVVFERFGDGLLSVMFGADSPENVLNSLDGE